MKEKIKPKVRGKAFDTEKEAQEYIDSFQS
jgi:hypothetical protein